MTDPLAGVEAPDPLYRVGRGPDPWEWPSWAYAKPDRTFGNRWDDPQGLYRVLYACSQRLGTFIETLSRFRPDPAVQAGLDEIEEDDDSSAGALRPGEVPRSWLDNRRMGQTRVDGEFADVGHSSSLVWLRSEMPDRVVHYRLPDLDASAIRLAVPRRFTQEISRRVFDVSVGRRRAYAGIAYHSRLGDEFENWAIFEPARLDPRLPRNLDATDPDFLEAMRLLGLALVDS